MLVDLQNLALRMHRLKLLQQLVRAKKQFELEGVDTTGMFKVELNLPNG